MKCNIWIIYEKNNNSYIFRSFYAQFFFFFFSPVHFVTYTFLQRASVLKSFRNRSGFCLDKFEKSLADSAVNFLIEDKHSTPDFIENLYEM